MCEDNNQECLQGLVNNHPTRTMPYWEKYFSTPPGDRVFIAPNEIINYINLDNLKNGYPNKTVAALPSKEFFEVIKNALSEIPDSVRKITQAKFAGVFLVNDLGGTGYTESILDEEGNPVAGFIVLDASVLKERTANQWVTWKESTPFKISPSIKINAIIESDKNDNHKNAVQYILLHELGHIISIGGFFHPPWNTNANNIKELEKYDFFNESWRIDQKENKFISRFDSTVLPERKNLVYYFGAELDADQMISTYNNLEKTDFVTVYAATHPADDWAESFVTYVHAVLMKKPFQINIKKNGKTEKSFKLCWGTPRCARKEMFLSKLFERI
ncbi:MAG: hypothetical protein ACI9KN_001037 [Gammaproteobacteria bacterium]|jgi:hypothetical protein